MTQKTSPPWSSLKRSLIGCFLFLAAVWIVSCVRDSIRRDSFNGVLLSGIHHLGPDFNIMEFYLDGYDGSNVGRGGGGGGNVCCVLLPKKWRPGLSVELRWAVGDWSKENTTEIEAGNYKSVSSGGIYRAQVPVEPYETAAHVFVHFYKGGRARVVSSEVGWGNPAHPILDDDISAADRATAGTRIATLFSESEIAAMNRRDDERRHSWFGGEWK